MNVIVCGTGEGMCQVDETGGYTEDWQATEETVRAAARSLMKAFGRWVEYEDVEQTIWLHYFEHREEIDSYQGSRIAYVRLKRAGSHYCQQEMAYKIGIDFGHQYDYTRGEVRGLVEFMLAGGPQGSEQQGTLCGWVDVQRGWACLDDHERYALEYAYGPDSREALTSSERTAVGRAVSNLQRAMNTPQV